MSRKQSTYAPRIPCQHRVVQADGTSKIRTYDKISLEKGDTLLVGRGVIVPKHFKPVDDNAKEDRQKQISDPAKHVKSKPDAILLSEILVHEGWAKSMSEAMQLITEDIEGVESVEDLDKKELDQKIDKVCDDYTVQEMKDILTEEGIGFFKGGKERKLAEKLVEHDLV